MLIKLYPKIEYKLFIMQKHHTLSALTATGLCHLSWDKNLWTYYHRCKDHGQKIQMKNEYTQNICLLSVRPRFFYYDGCKVLKHDNGDILPKKIPSAE